MLGGISEFSGNCRWKETRQGEPVGVCGIRDLTTISGELGAACVLEQVFLLREDYSVFNVLE